MKSCIEWRKTFPYLDQVDQYNIVFKNKTKQLLVFLNQYGVNKRVNIIFEHPSKSDIELVIQLYKTGKYNIAACLEADQYFIQMLKEANVKFYLPLHINSWDALQYAINLGVSDVFITEEMGFDLKRIRKVLKDTGIQVRCYANISQIQYPYEANDGLKGFYIRPEDMDVYDKYVDVIEFYKSVDIQKVLYQAYFKEKKWDGPLMEIVKGLKNPVDNYYILGSDFAKTRVDCKKKCIKGERCQMCDVVIALANSLRNSPDYQVFRKQKE